MCDEGFPQILNWAHSIRSHVREAMTAGRHARRAADVGSGSSVEVTISQIPISLHFHDFRLACHSIALWQALCMGLARTTKRRRLPYGSHAMVRPIKPWAHENTITEEVQ